MTDRFDFAVVGAGMAGASAAYALAQRGRTILIERETHAGYHATGRSGAAFIGTYGNATVRALNALSAPFFTNTPAGFCEVPIARPLGAVYVAGPGGSARLSEFATVAGPSLSRLSAQEAALLVPVLDPQWVEAALFEPDALAIDVDAMLQAYLRGFRKRGGTVIMDAEASARRGDAGWQILAGGNTVTCDCLVNAAGAWADAFAAQCGVAPLGLTPLRRTAVLTAVPDHVRVADWPIVLDIDEGFYFKPDAGKLMVSPADETPSEPHDAFAEPLEIAIAMDRLQTATTLRLSHVAASWAGLRTFSPDRSPVLGHDPDYPGFFWLAGQGGYGIQTAPAMAMLCASIVAGEALTPPLAGLAAALSPSRLRPERRRRSA